MPYLTPDTAPSGTICRMLVIPNDWRWISIVNGALSELMYSWRFEQFGTATPEETAAVFQAMVEDFLVSECNPAVTYPTRAEIDHITSTVLAGNPLLWNAIAAQARGGAMRQSAAAINDEWTNQVYLKAGNYTCYVLGVKSAASGILDLYFSPTNVLHFDFYAAGTTNNALMSSAVTIAADGVQKLNGRLATKNAASSGYGCNITMIYFKQATD